MSILAVFIDDFACTAAWRKAEDPLPAPDQFRPSLILSSQVLLGKTGKPKKSDPKKGGQGKEDQDFRPRDLACVSGLTEDVKALLKRVGWVADKSFKKFGLKEALETGIADGTLQAYLGALIKGCLDLAGPDRGISEVRVAMTLIDIISDTAIKNAISDIEKILGRGLSVKYIGDAMTLALGCKATWDSVQTGENTGKPVAHGYKVYAAASLWRHGFSARIIQYPDDSNGMKSWWPAAAPFFCPFDNYKLICEGSEKEPGMFESIRTAYLMGFSTPSGGCDKLKSLREWFDSNVARTPPLAENFDPNFPPDDVRKLQGRFGRQMNASKTVLVGSIFLDDRISLVLAPKSEESGRQQASGTQKDVGINFALGCESNGETFCLNRGIPLLGVGAVLWAVHCEADDGKGGGDTNNDRGDAQRITLNENGKQTFDNCSGIKLNILGQPSDAGRAVVVEARNCADGSWLICAHLDDRRLPIKKEDVKDTKDTAVLKLEANGRYRLIPDKTRYELLRGLRHLIEEGLVLFHPNSHPLLPQLETQASKKAQAEKSLP